MLLAKNTAINKIFIITLNGILRWFFCFSCLCEISFSEPWEESSYSNLKEFSLLLFSCNVKTMVASFLKLSLFPSLIGPSFPTLLFLSSFPILLNFDVIILFNFVSVQCGTLSWWRTLAGSFQESFGTSLLYALLSLPWTHCTCLILEWEPPPSHFSCCSYRLPHCLVNSWGYLEVSGI